MEHYCELIAAMKVRTSNKKGRHLEVSYFETEQSRQVLKELKLAILAGKLVALSGLVGSGKTATLRHVQEQLGKEKECLVAKSLSVEKSQISLGTLILALFYDLATENDFKVPTQPERHERALRDLIRRRQKTVALFIDEAHDLHSMTLVGLKRLMEVVRDGGRQGYNVKALADLLNAKSGGGAFFSPGQAATQPNARVSESDAGGGHSPLAILATATRSTRQETWRPSRLRAR